MKAQSWRGGITILSLTSALDGVVCRRYVPAAVPQVMIRYPAYRRLGGHQGRSGRVQKIVLPPRFVPLTVQLSRPTR